MNFNLIDMNAWSRKDVFNHFIKDVKCVITLTADVDVTELLKICKKNGLNFYPVYIYLVSRAVNKRKELRMGYDDKGNVGYWEYVNPSYIVFHTEDEMFTNLSVEYVPDFYPFYNNIVCDIEKYKNIRGFDFGFPYPNIFNVSCLPWISYKSFDLHVFDEGTYLAPVITWGKYEQADDKTIMSLTLQIHHAACDGFHVSRFFTDVQKETEKLIDSINQF